MRDSEDRNCIDRIEYKRFYKNTKKYEEKKRKEDRKPKDRYIYMEIT
jgi:hypothetical protein